jgi:hypothetical protein
MEAICIYCFYHGWPNESFLYCIDRFDYINANKSKLINNGYYKIINNIKKTKRISEKLSQYRYWLSFFYIGRVYLCHEVLPRALARGKKLT